MLKLSLSEKLHTDRLIIQRLRYEDAAEIFYAYASKPEATRYVSFATHKSIEDTIRFLRYADQAWAQGKDYSFSIRLKASNRLIGSIGIVNDNGQIQFGYILSPTQWGKGYATETCLAMLEAIQTQPVVIDVSTFVATENVASARVLRKCGLIQEAIMPGWFLFPNLGPERRDCIRFIYPLRGSAK